MPESSVWAKLKYEFFLSVTTLQASYQDIIISCSEQGKTVLVQLITFAPQVYKHTPYDSDGK